MRRNLPLSDLDPKRQSRIIRELATQLEDIYQEVLDRGLSETTAAAEAERQIEDWSAFGRAVASADRSHRQDSLDRWIDRLDERPLEKQTRWEAMAEVLRDVAYTLRQWRTRPGVAVVAIVTLALGIGANTAIFSAVHGILLQSLPYPDPDRLAVVSLSWPEGRFWLSEQEVLTLREQATLFEGFEVIDEGGDILLGESEPERIDVGLVSAGLLQLLDVPPVLGRVFEPEEEQPGHPRTVVVSYGLWQRRFGGDPNVLGRTLEFDGASPARIIGVMPREFEVLVSVNATHHKGVAAWHPHQVDYQTVDRGRNLIVLTRRKPGVSWEAAQEELDRIARSIFTDPEDLRTYRAFPLHEDMVEDVRGSMLFLMAASGFVLLVACANVASLLLTRGLARQHETALQMALGATRGRLVRQSLTESAVLAALGGAAGVALAAVAVRALSAWLPAELPGADQLSLNGVVLGVSLGLTLATGFFSGVVPAIRAGRTDIDAAIKTGAGGRFSSGSTLLQRGLIVAEIALALMLLVGGSLVVRSFIGLQSVDLGYDPQNTTTVSVEAPPSRYATREAVGSFFTRVQDEVAAVPGVEKVGGNYMLPFGPSLAMFTYTFYDSPLSNAGDNPVRNALARPTLPGYLETLEVDLLAGRYFTPDDVITSERVAIIDDTLAAELWPGESPIGRRLARGENPAEPLFVTIVGVVGNLRLTSITGERDREVFLPFEQGMTRQVSFVARTSIPSDRVQTQIREAVRAIDPNIALYDIGRLDETVNRVIAPERLTSWLMGLFAAIGLVLAVVGVYGVMSYAVSRRTREIGIRMTLGAMRRDVYIAVSVEGLRLAAVGIVLGLIGALLAAPVLESLLFGVSTSDPGNYIGVAAALLVAALLACAVPAWRATRIDPMVALRHE